MAFADDFVSCMTGGGINIDASAVPDSDTLAAVVAYAQQYLQGLPAEVAAGLDAATANDNTATILADSDVNVVDSSYMALLWAFDAASGVPLSTCLEWCVYCIQHANEANQGGGA